MNDEVKPWISGERFLARRGFADSRNYSAAELGLLLEEYAAAHAPDGETVADNFKTVTDHKYIDQRCHDGGCQALVFDETMAALVEALKKTHVTHQNSHICEKCKIRDAALQKAGKL